MNWIEQFFEDLAEGLDMALSHYANQRSRPPMQPGPTDPPPNTGNPMFPPELIDLIHQLGAMEIWFVWTGERIEIRLQPSQMQAAREHYANQARRENPPRPGERTIAKRRLALQTLGLPAEATPEEIRARYKKLARQLHPDRHPNSKTTAERMIRVNLAYAYLEKEF